MLRHDPDALPDVAWPSFLAGFDWRQGEHVSLIGPTGSGKTTLARAILARRAYVAILATKPRDPSLDVMRRVDGYKLVRDWPPPPLQQRVLVWPRLRTRADVATQARVFADVLDGVFTVGGWCVFADELRYLANNLRLADRFELLWLQGRSLGVSLVAATQRPAHVPLSVYDQATHLFFWRDNDEANLKRIGGIGWLAARSIRETVARLPVHDVLYVNSRTGVMLTTRAERT